MVSAKPVGRNGVDPGRDGLFFYDASVDPRIGIGRARR